jgi:hypothetical protein
MNQEKSNCTRWPTASRGQACPTLKNSKMSQFQFADMCLSEYIWKCDELTRWSLISSRATSPAHGLNSGTTGHRQRLRLRAKGTYQSARISKRSCARSNTGIKPLSSNFRIMARQGQGAWHGVRWDGKTAVSFPLNETDETKAMRALLLQLEEAAMASIPPGHDAWIVGNEPFIRIDFPNCRTVARLQTAK